MYDAPALGAGGWERAGIMLVLGGGTRDGNDRKSSRAVRTPPASLPILFNAGVSNYTVAGTPDTDRQYEAMATTIVEQTRRPAYPTPTARDHDCTSSTRTRNNRRTDGSSTNTDIVANRRRPILSRGHPRTPLAPPLGRCWRTVSVRCQRRRGPSGRRKSDSEGLTPRPVRSLPGGT